MRFILGFSDLTGILLLSNPYIYIIGASLLAIFGRMPWPALFTLYQAGHEELLGSWSLSHISGIRLY
jgi:hypothetical protein